MGISIVSSCFLKYYDDWDPTDGWCHQSHALSTTVKKMPHEQHPPTTSRTTTAMKMYATALEDRSTTADSYPECAIDRMLSLLDAHPDHPPLLQCAQQVLQGDAGHGRILLMQACARGLPNVCQILIKLGVNTNADWCGGKNDEGEPLNYALKVGADTRQSPATREGAKKCSVAILAKHKLELGPIAFSAKHVSDLLLWSHGTIILRMEDGAQIRFPDQWPNHYDRFHAVQVLLKAGVNPNARADLFRGKALQPAHYFLPLFVCARCLKSLHNPKQRDVM